MLTVSNLNLSIDGKRILSNLSFEIKEPTFVAVIGHNGSGKTSLLNTMMNLLPYQGEIFLLKPPALLNQKNPVHFDITAKELAVMGLFSQKKIFDNYNKKDYQLVENTFLQLGILPLLERTITGLSGGELQLVWMAQLLLQNRDILLLDEPTQYLDIKNKKKIFSLLQEFVNEKNKLVLCVTHDLLNLYEMNGFLLNLSADNPTLETITEQAIEKHLTLLEH